MQRRPHRLGLFSVLALVSAFLAGVASQRWLLRDARADSMMSTSTIYVPSSGLVFESLDGKPIARLSRDAQGGVFELYDGRQQVMRRIPSMATASTNIDVSNDGFPFRNVARQPGF